MGKIILLWKIWSYWRRGIG